MPTMPRISGRATKIAYEIMGEPDNLAYKKSKQQKEIDAKLLYNETERSR